MIPPDDAAPTLNGPRVTLRAVEERDRADRLTNGRDAEAVRMYGGDTRELQPFTEADADRWYNAKRGDRFSWVIEVDTRCIGGVRLHSLNVADRRARLAIGIDVPNLRGRGIGTETVQLLLRHAFETLGLHRVDLRVLAYNSRAIGCYERCGFVREGVERESARVGEEWHDDVMMSVLDYEYSALARAWFPSP